jgi:hypothetical protein
MNVNIPEHAREHFWVEPLPGHTEFWSFRFKPPCKPGDKLIFRFDKKPVAEAIVLRVEKPGMTRCSQTGKFLSGWKVFWSPESFIDTRI